MDKRIVHQLFAQRKKQRLKVFKKSSQSTSFWNFASNFVVKFNSTSHVDARLMGFT
jgi:hypothetical protein